MIHNIEREILIEAPVEVGYPAGAQPGEGNAVLAEFTFLPEGGHTRLPRRRKARHQLSDEQSDQRR